MKHYYPYAANDGKHKFYRITKEDKKVYFGQANASDFTIHKDEARRQRYKARHKNEDWTKSGIDTAGFWSFRYLWSYPTKQEAYKHIKAQFL